MNPGTVPLGGLTSADVPDAVRSRIALLLRDFVAVSLAGRAAPTARIAADYAAGQHAGTEATALFDGRRLTATGAAWANGVLANALDFDDGHRLCKGHPGANVVPAALAVAECVDAGSEEFLAAVAVGYEIAIRAGVDLHGRSGAYHASGAWGAVGAAAACARLLELDASRLTNAMGLAEYHAPIAPIMRSVAHPAMTKDGCGQGALLGVSCALLARGGFTAAPPALLQGAGLADLGERWHVLDVYVKPYPCCRWSHPAIEAALAMRADGLDAEEIERVRVRTFEAAAALARVQPETTEQAQYSLVWPVAVVLARGRFAVDDVLPASFEDRRVAALLPRIEAEVDASFEQVFPARRLSEVVVRSKSGEERRSGAFEAGGEPDDPNWGAVVERKFSALVSEVGSPEPGRTSFGGRTCDELLSLLTHIVA